MKFSITIPAYKSKYMKECIESILAQTYEDFELIIIDDHSPEDIKSIVEQFNDKRICYIRNEKNCGAIDVVDNWNKCLSHANGEWIICIGDDDKLLPNCLKEYNQLIETHPNVNVVHGWTEIIDENSNFKSVTASRIEFESVYSFIWHRWENRHHQYIGDFAFRTNKLRERGGFYKLPLAWASDDISAAIMADKQGIANTQSVVFQYRESSITISSTGNNKLKMKAIMQEELWYSKFLYEKPLGEIDLKFWITLKKEFNRYFLKKKAFYITFDIKENVKNILFWLRRRKEYNLSLKLIIYSWIMSLK